jgi:hypothetical protein
MAANQVPTSNALFQSGYLHLQSCGSDGSNDIKTGWHLRWALTRNLGEMHLPKGNYTSDPLYQTSQFFNKPNDFITINRVFYTDLYKSAIDLNTPVPPTRIVINAQLNYAEWLYSVTVGTITSQIALRFTDLAAYQQIINTPIDPNQTPLKVIRLYTKKLELRVRDNSPTHKTKLFFSAEMNIDFIQPQNASSAYVRLETISKPDSLAPDRIISSRKNFINPALQPSGANGIRVEVDNIEFLRFDYSNSYPKIIRIEAYQEFIEGINNGNPGAGWALYGSHALTLDPTEALFHFDAGFTTPPVNNFWPRFNGTSAGSQAYRVSQANYVTKFGSQNQAETLAQMVQNYFLFSKITNNYKANDIIPATAPPDDNSTMQISYLDMLRLISLDYHAARLLCLGEIDERINGPNDPTRIVHIAQYLTTAPQAQLLDTPGLTGAINHLYMTLPTRLTDSRFPIAPILQNPEYGLSVDNGTGVPVLVTDSQGYSLYDDSRYIKLLKGSFLYDYPYSSGNFFQGAAEFNLSAISKPVFFGIEYKDHGVATFPDETLSSDPDFIDGGSKQEVIPIPDQSNPIFIHQETKLGIHDYALYGVNALGRTSPISNIVSTDTTVFPKRNHILPPFNLGCQLIQEEEFLMLTSGDEQTMLANLTTADKTLVRVTFDWNHVHNAAYQFANKVEFYFRSEPALSVRGKVKNVIDLTDELSAVYTTRFDITSVNPVQTIQPLIIPADKQKFIHSYFACGQRQYLIEDIFLNDPSGYPVFIIKRIKEGSLLEVPLNSGQMTVATSFVKPAVDEIFYTAQNMGDESSWDNKLAKTVSLQVLDTIPYFEPQTEADGSTTPIRIGGITEQVTITEIYDPTPFPPVPLNTPTGIFEITFGGNPLNAVTLDPDVSFYKGIVRVYEDPNPAFYPAAGNPEHTTARLKVLDVFDIDTSGPQLKLKVYDSSFSYIIGTGFQDDYVPIITGPLVQINFHPSYKVYLKVDSANGFDKSTILPAPDEDTKQTFLGARAKDTLTNPLLTSVITPPSLIISRTILEPEPPEPPVGPEFATRPDYYGKATYTMQTPFHVAGREPYAMIFYRAMDVSILDSLYLPATAKQILIDLENLTGNELAHTKERWVDLIHGLYDNSVTGNGKFIQYVANGYRFPLPDNTFYKVKGKNAGGTVDVFPFTGNFLDTVLTDTANLNIHGTGNLKVIDFVVMSVSENFIPLTEEPILYKFIRESYETSPRRPKIRDSHGNLLPPQLVPNNDEYEPWPMAVKVPGQSGLVRFTDFTIDGASTKSKFFYFAVEMSNTFKLSAPSALLGPISLINSYSADPPEIRKVLTRLADQIQGLPSAVTFSINNYIESEYIKKIQLFRTTNSVDSNSVRTMTLVNEFDLIDEIKDEFGDLTTPPFGDDIFYRLVALREINNEQNLSEFIPSLPTKVLKARVVDTVNPPAPEILPSPPPSLVNLPPLTLINVILTWQPTCYNGTYYLYKMNSTGNWNLLTSIKSNDPLLTYTVGDLPKEDSPGGNPVFHRFKVKVENSSGLFNLSDMELTL